MKGIKKIGTLACVGATMVSMAAPVMAKTTTDVTYTTGAVTDDTGKVVLVIPTDVSFVQGKTEAYRDLTVRMADQTKKLPANFKAQTTVKSANNGQLKYKGTEAADAITYQMYTVTNAQGAGANEVVLTNSSQTAVKVNDFNATAEVANMTQILKFNAKQNEAERNETSGKYNNGDVFKDTLTFGITVTAGTGIK